MEEISKISREFRKKNGGFNVDLAFVLQFYDCYARERNLAVVAHAFGVTPWNLQKIIERHSELQLAMTMADESRKKGILANYILSNLSPQARAIWDKITKLSTYEEVDACFKNKPLKLRQQLFCTAVLYTSHDYAKALRIVGVPYGDFMRWRTDPEFSQMLEELQWHKKQFFHKSLMGLVAEGHPGAVIFVNRTVNADMGFSERLDLNVHGQVGGAGDYPLDQLDLPPAVLKQILEAVERKKAADAKDAAVEAEIIPEVRRIPAKVPAKK
jgi:hypothetical protein